MYLNIFVVFCVLCLNSISKAFFQQYRNNKCFISVQNIHTLWFFFQQYLMSLNLYSFFNHIHIPLILLITHISLILGFEKFMISRVSKIWGFVDMDFSLVLSVRRLTRSTLWEVGGFPNYFNTIPQLFHNYSITIHNYFTKINYFSSTIHHYSTTIHHYSIISPLFPTIPFLFSTHP